MSETSTRVATGTDVPGLEALFGEHAHGCHCRYWHFGGDKNAWQARLALEPEGNRAELREAMAAGREDALGVVAIDDGDVVGWLKLAPNHAMTKLYEQRLYRRLPCFDGDREGVYVIGCILVRPDRRRRGVATRLLEAAIALAESRGARAIEAFPRRSAEPLRDDELWLGPASTLARAGFEEVHAFAPYPVLRRVLR